METRTRPADGSLVELRYAGTRRAQARDPDFDHQPAVHFVQERVELVHVDGVTEWYVNGPAGLEHGFVLSDGPPGDGPVQVLVDVTRASARQYGEDIAFEAPDDRTLRYSKLLVEDSSGQQLPSTMYLDDAHRIVLQFDDANAAYPVTIDPIITGVLDVRLRGSQKYGAFGISVAAAGDVNGDGYDDVVIGADLYDAGELNEGAVFVYHGRPGGLDLVPSARLEVDHEGAQFGYSVDAAGDVDGDGFDDVIAGAPKLSGAHFHQGAAFVFRGSDSGLGAEPDWMITGMGAHDLAGTTVIGAGDLDGDGFADVAVGAPGVDVYEKIEVFTEEFGVQIRTEKRENGGNLLVFPGASAGLPVLPSVVIEGREAFEEVGIMTAAAGDTNADGFDDLLLGTPDRDEQSGRAALFMGSQLGIGKRSQWLVDGSTPGQRLGSTVAGVGDVNGDGFHDIAVVEEDSASGLQSIAVYHGGSRGPAKSPDADLLATAAHPLFAIDQGFGYAIAEAGDVNGDGYDDVAVGIPFLLTVQTGPLLSSRGAVALYPGSRTGVQSQAFELIEGTEQNAAFGVALAGIGDVNQDGFDDLIAGASRHDHSDQPFPSPVLDAGGAFLYFGSAFGINPSMTARLVPPEKFGSLQLEAAGDLNGDGHADLAVTDPSYDNGAALDGALVIYTGTDDGLNTTPALLLPGSPAASSRFGHSAAGVGDLNNDGFDDLAIGAPSYANGQASEGAVYVYLGHPVDTLAFNAPTLLESNVPGATLGTSVAAAGRRNADVYRDLVAGAPGYSNGQSSEGAAYVFSGRNGGVDPAPLVLESNLADARRGELVAGGGDLDGDGTDEIAFSSIPTPAPQPHLPAPSMQIGIAFQNGSIVSIDAPAPVADMDFVGDLNGDGFGEFAFGMPAQGVAGQVSVVTGWPTLGLSPALLVLGSEQLHGHKAGEQFGTRIAAAGDVDGDGLDDLLVGAPYHSLRDSKEGAIYAHHGAAGSSFGLERSPAWQAVGDRFLGLLGAQLVVTDTRRSKARWIASTLDSAEIRLFAIDSAGISIAIDDDEDGFPDQQEARFGLDRTDPYDGRADRDTDGLSDAFEFGLGTDLAVADTDGDGSADGVEWVYHILFSVGDGPLTEDADGDQDGLSDAIESLLGTTVTRADTDSDALPDGYETLQMVRLGLPLFGVPPVAWPISPLNADGHLDFDFDGFDNVEEYWARSDPLDALSRPVRRPNDLDYDGLTDDVDPDDDNDGMSDAWELEQGLDPSNPADAGLDSDADTLTNLEEFRRGSDPDLADTDADALRDDTDNCPAASNPDQHDVDRNGVGDLCEPFADAAGMADASEDDVPDIAVFAHAAGVQPRARLVSGVTGTQFKALSFLDSNWQGLAIDTVADGNGDGASGDPALAMLLTDPVTGRLLVHVRDAGTQATVSKISFLNREWAAVDVAVVNDVNGDGDSRDAAISVLALNKSDGRLLVEVRSLASGARLHQRRFLQPGWIPVAVAASSGPGLTPTVGVLARNAATGELLVQTRRLADGVLVRNTGYFDATWSPRDLAPVADGNGDGLEGDPAWLVLAESQSSGTTRVQGKTLAGGTLVWNTRFLPADHSAKRLVALPDVNGNGAGEVGVLAQSRSSGQFRIEIRDFDSRNTILNAFP